MEVIFGEPEAARPNGGNQVIPGLKHTNKQHPVSSGSADSDSTDIMKASRAGSDVYGPERTDEVQDPAHRPVASAGQDPEIRNVPEEVQPAGNSFPLQSSL